jgi:hypothetical protein
MKMLKGFSLVLGLCVLLSVIAFAQTSVKIYATDGVKSDSLLLGMNPAATNHLDAGLGEVELPPVGPVFDVRFVNKTGVDTLGVGSLINIHKLVYPTQTDAFRIQYRVSDEALLSSSYMTFTWQSGLATVGGGFWVLTNSAGAVLCDMTQVTSYSFAINEDDGPGPFAFNLVTGDNIGFFTATSDSLIAAKNSKGKAGIEKKGYTTSEATWDLVQGVVPDSLKPKGMYIEFGQAITTFSATQFDTYTPDAASKKWLLTYSDPAKVCSLNTHILVHAIGNKGKALTIKKYYFYDGNPANYKVYLPLKVKTAIIALPTPTTSRVRLYMPNWWNVGLAAFPVAGIVTGNPTLVDTVIKTVPYYRVLFHKNFKTMMGALVSKTGIVDAADTYGCFTTLGGKPWKPTKAGKFSSPKGPDLRFQSKLYAELLALKFNTYVSSTGYMGAGNTMFSKMHYKATTGDPTWSDGKVVDTLIAYADDYLSSCDNSVHTGAELLHVVQRINSLYTTKFDTATWDIGGLVLKSIPVPLVANGLYRESPTETAPIAITANYPETTPFQYKLDQNYPNPFNPTTTIAFDLPADAFVTLKIYNTLGQEVATLLDHAEFTEGQNEVEFNASNFSSGVYFYQLIVNDGEFNQVKKMMLLK